jgi:hypothetical protein
VQLSVDPQAVTASADAVTRAAETFAGLTVALRAAAAASASAAGGGHATAGIEAFGAHWTAVLQVLAVAAEETGVQLRGAARHYVDVDGGLAGAAAWTPR